MARSEERAAQNEISFRDANEKLGEKRVELDAEGTTPFLCESSDPRCTQVLLLTLREYEHVRSNPTWFVVAAGHDAGDGAAAEEHDGTRSSRRRVLQARWPWTKIPGMSDRGERVGVNEALFREVNERIEDLQSDLGQAPAFDVVCECGDPACLERFTIGATEYADVRKDARYFVVVPGHVAPDVERVVERRQGYVVIEKMDPDAARAAEEMA